jgi:uncharacterized protein (DUF2062 family)
MCWVEWVVVEWGVVAVRQGLQAAAPASALVVLVAVPVLVAMQVPALAPALVLALVDLLLWSYLLTVARHRRQRHHLSDALPVHPGVTAA